MENLLLLGLINSLIIFGFYEATAYDTKRGKYDQENSNILGWFAFKGDKLLPYLLREPLWDCRLCMSSFHSLYIYWGYMWITDELVWTSLIVYPAYVLMLAGINAIIMSLKDKLDS